ncbi:Alpha/Beta hydrolase protein [Stachybotrys elegans]|uniref:Alpha/Beta hydrolase protein n=1 Tax=Stachybotrys elegans TaxID=80388 RepID=A0A8K0SP61_9HYPO|nr:Alpha/Beta hydrolase protein [Stachybotrys elegans]
MILGPVSLVDCLVFCIFLAPQLLLQAGVFLTLSTALQALPFLLLRLPIEFTRERYFTPPAQQPIFVKESTIFEDVVIRCVRYAFAKIPASVGRVFFSRQVSLPFIRWRLLRHGYLRFPVSWRSHRFGEGNASSEGVWIMHQPELPPDIVVYYAHGGGFAMGSSFFYLEFLVVWHHLLLEAGYKNPAIFALEYTLVPDDIYPRQLHETLLGYKHVLDVVHDPAKVCVAGDSAGGTLILSMLLELGAQAQARSREQPASQSGPRASLSGLDVPMLCTPRMAVLISPWVTLMTNLHARSMVDYLDRESLWRYAHEYAGEYMLHNHPASPGCCLDDGLWKAASPQKGYYVTYGSDEVFGPDVENFINRQSRLGIKTAGLRVKGGIHAWPVACLFLSSSIQDRLSGLKPIVKEIRRRFDDKSAEGRV